MYPQQQQLLLQQQLFPQQHPQPQPQLLQQQHPQLLPPPLPQQQHSRMMIRMIHRQPPSFPLFHIALFHLSYRSEPYYVGRRQKAAWPEKFFARVLRAQPTKGRT